MTSQFMLLSGLSNISATCNKCSNGTTQTFSLLLSDIWYDMPIRI